MTTSLLTALAVSTASAQSGTLERIKNTGTINIGYRADQFPFAYEGADRKPIGYTLDLCRRIVDRMQDQLGTEPIRFRMVALNPGNRVAMVANGSVDMECDLSTDNTGREEQVAFLGPTFMASTKIVVRASSGLSAVSDLTGKRLLVIAGTSNVQFAMELNTDRHLNMKVFPVKDGPEAVRMMEAGTGDAFLWADILIYGLIARSSQPSNYKVLDETLSKRTYGIMVRRQDTAFKDAANSALREVVKSGEFEEIYQRWFQSPIEPDNVNLNISMSHPLQFRLNATKLGTD